MIRESPSHSSSSSISSSSSSRHTHTHTFLFFPAHTHTLDSQRTATTIAGSTVPHSGQESPLRAIDVVLAQLDVLEPGSLPTK